MSAVPVDLLALVVSSAAVLVLAFCAGLAVGGLVVLGVLARGR